MCEQETEQGSSLDNQEFGGKADAGDKVPTVLIVDDSESLREAARELLEYCGYRVLTARNGQEGLEIFRAHCDAIDLVILDWVMPRLGGEQCLEGLLEIDPEVRVLSSTAHYMDDDVYDKLEPKVKGFVPKPINPAISLKVVARALRD